MEVPTILYKAADYIEENGWYRGDFFGPNKSACLLGAIARVLDPTVDDKSNDESWIAFDRVTLSKEYREAADCVESYLGLSAADYNDSLGRTSDEVITALRNAAAKGCANES